MEYISKVQEIPEMSAGVPSLFLSLCFSLSLFCFSLSAFFSPNTHGHRHYDGGIRELQAFIIPVAILDSRESDSFQCLCIKFQQRSPTHLGTTFWTKNGQACVTSPNPVQNEEQGMRRAKPLLGKGRVGVWQWRSQPDLTKNAKGLCWPNSDKAVKLGVFTPRKIITRAICHLLDYTIRLCLVCQSLEFWTISDHWCLGQAFHKLSPYVTGSGGIESLISLMEARSFNHSLLLLFISYVTPVDSH